MSVEAILFDWGGTLARVDGQVEAFRRGAARILESLDREPIPELVNEMIGLAVEAERQAAATPELREVDLTLLLQGWAGRHGLNLDDRQLAAAMVTLGKFWVGSALTVMPGVREALQTLRQMGFRIGLVSNCFIPVEYCQAELKYQNLADLLDFAVFSSGVGYRKPSPRIYVEALDRLSSDGRRYEPSQILFVGDSPAYDVIAPAALGMRTALVASDASIWSAADYERARPDLRLDSVTQLPSSIRQLG